MRDYRPGNNVSRRHQTTARLRVDPRNYLGAALILAARLRCGELGVLHVSHDDWCQLLSGTGACNCSPDVRLEQRDEWR
jgi:hypothetical protein